MTYPLLSAILVDPLGSKHQVNDSSTYHMGYIYMAHHIHVTWLVKYQFMKMKLQIGSSVGKFSYLVL